MPLLIRGNSREEAGPVALARLEEVGLLNRAQHRAGELSGGEQQRVVLARALVGNPSVLLADEPTGSLDQRTGEAMMDLLDSLHQSRKLTSIHVTHNLNFAKRADRVLALDRGRIEDARGRLMEPFHALPTSKQLEVRPDDPNPLSQEQGRYHV